MNARCACIFLTVLLVVLGASIAGAKEILVTPGDTLLIRVEGEPDITKTYLVNDDGKITLPEAGDVKVAGQTLTQLKDSLTKVLVEYVREPKLTVEMPSSSHSNMKEMLVYGEVRRPGNITIKEDSHLMDVLNMAGGLSDNADREKSVIFRKDSTTPISLDLEALLKGDITRNIVVQEGDTLFIPAKTQGSCVITGQVRNPGERNLKTGMTLMEAIIQAGGFTPEADQTQVRITRRDQAPILVNMQEEANSGAVPLWQSFTVQSGDNIWVPENKEAYFNVLGGVRTPGQYPIKKRITITDAITQAGGFAERAKKDQVQVARASSQGEGPKTVRVNMDKLFKGDISQNIEIHPGDTISVDVSKDKRSFQDVFFRDVLPVVSTIVYWGALAD